MPAELLPKMILLIIVVGVCPGPANLLAMSAGMRHNGRSALAVWAGMAAGFFTAALAIAVATHVVGPMVESYVHWLKYVGAAYIVWLAWNLYRHRDQDALDHNLSFGHGFVVQITNAKMIVFDLTIFTTFVLPPSHEFAPLLGAIGWLIIAGPAANALWLIAGHWLRPLFVKHRRRIDTVMSLALLVCAALLVI